MNIPQVVPRKVWHHNASWWNRVDKKEKIDFCKILEYWEPSFNTYFLLHFWEWGCSSLTWTTFQCYHVAKALLSKVFAKVLMLLVSYPNYQPIFYNNRQYEEPSRFNLSFPRYILKNFNRTTISDDFGCWKVQHVVLCKGAVPMHFLP